MKNILIIGCGLIGSSLLRSIWTKKISKNIFVYEKSKSNISVDRQRVVNRLTEQLSNDQVKSKTKSRGL